MRHSVVVFPARGGTSHRSYHLRVPPRLASLVRARLSPAVAATVLTALLAAGCAGSFDRSEPCTSDGSASGAYPELEAVVPTSMRGRGPDKLDSGRNCTARALGSLADHGVTELHFAGATWDLGSSSGVTLAVFDAPNLEAAWVAEQFETGARAGKDIQSVDARTIQLPNGTSASRLDVLDGESYDSVVVWPGDEHVRVAVIVSFIRAIQTKEAHDAVVTEALQAATAP